MAMCQRQASSNRRRISKAALLMAIGFGIVNCLPRAQHEFGRVVSLHLGHVHAVIEVARDQE
eukprot:2273692-Amphidinium_carterae.2